MICLDASLVVRLISQQKGAEKIEHLFEKWVKHREVSVAPYLIEYEASNALWRKHQHGDLGSEAFLTAVSLFRELNITYLFDFDYTDRAFYLAQNFNLSTIYDACYLAVAETKRCSLYTADHAFSKKVQSAFPFVKYYDEAI